MTGVVRSTAEPPRALHARAEPRLIAFGTSSQLGKFPPLPPWIEKISCGGDLRYWECRRPHFMWRSQRVLASNLAYRKVRCARPSKFPSPGLSLKRVNPGSAGTK